MKTTKMLAIWALALSLILCQAKVSEAGPMGTAFTYQGSLNDAGSPADGEYDFQFKLFDDPNVITGNQVGSDVNKPDVDVIDGYFTVELDFNEPNAFNGDARWLEIGVRPGVLADPDVYTTLTPRQELTPTPYALHAMNGLWDANGTDIYYNDGNVGIGTTSPEAKLDIISATGGDGLIVESSITNPDGVLAEFCNDSATPDGTLLSVMSGPSDDTRFEIDADGTTYFSGDVGIGTTNPQVALDVVGNGASTVIKGTNWEGGTGVHGQSGTGNGVYGESIAGNGDGVHGEGAGAGHGVYGEHANERWGYLGGEYGAYGSGPTGSHGYLGGYNVGVYGEGSDFGVFGRSSGTAGYFDGDVTVTNGDLGVSGTKNFIQPHPVDPNKEIVYVTVEAPEAVVFIRGTAQLKDGNAVIELPDYFRVVAAEEGVQVQVTPIEDCNGMFIVSRSRDRVEVKELMGGKHNARFDYFITAVRKGFEGHEPVVANTHFKPHADETAQEFEARYSKDNMATKAIRSMLISNGILTEEGKLNSANFYEDVSVHTGSTNSDNGIAVKSLAKDSDFFADGPGINYDSSSSIRWKRNIGDIDNPLGKVLRLRGVYFNWDAEHGGGRDVGMIAEEVGQVLPEIVGYEENGVDASGMDYGKLTPVLVEAVKALKIELDEQTKQQVQKDAIIERLGEENRALSKRLATIESLVEQLGHDRKELKNAAF